MTNDRTGAERMARLREKRRRAGLTEVLVWVPPDRTDELRRIAREMREKPRPEDANGGPP